MRVLILIVEFLVCLGVGFAVVFLVKQSWHWILDLGFAVLAIVGLKLSIANGWQVYKWLSLILLVLTLVTFAIDWPDRAWPRKKDAKDQDSTITV